MNVLTLVRDKHVQNHQHGVGSESGCQLLSGQEGKAGLEAAPRGGLVLLVGMSSSAIGFCLAPPGAASLQHASEVKQH